MADTADITLWLNAAREGDRSALDQVLGTLYHELHAMARRQLSGQMGHTLDATALVHEAYLKLVGRREIQFDDRAHFFAYAASAMRSVVVDYARQTSAPRPSRSSSAPTTPRSPVWPRSTSAWPGSWNCAISPACPKRRSRR